MANGGRCCEGVMHGMRSLRAEVIHNDAMWSSSVRNMWRHGGRSDARCMLD